jgi:hypothetical protein
VVGLPVALGHVELLLDRHYGELTAPPRFALQEVQPALRRADRGLLRTQRFPPAAP